MANVEIVETGEILMEGNTKSIKISAGDVLSSKVKGSKRVGKKKQDVQRKYWAFTLFYLDDVMVETVETHLKPVCDKYVIGREVCPTTGRKHLQGFIALKGKGKRFSQVRDLIKCEWHLEPCNGSEEQNIKYCSKEGNYVKHGMKIDVEVITNLFPYQKLVEDIIKGKPDKRAVYWFYEPTGDIGKSELCKYLIKYYNAILITNGKKTDIVNLVFNRKEDIEFGRTNLIVIDIPRNEYNACSYNAIEEIKNGMVVNTKYETGSFIFNSPHIIVFSNFYPETTKLSKDRWHIYKINKDDKTATRENVIEKKLDLTFSDTDVYSDDSSLW
ncbi:replication-associated protein [Crucivirus-102]|nr:replication-associated protein [Crucivirus-102]